MKKQLYVACLFMLAVVTTACSSTRELAAADEPYRPKSGEVRRMD